jgi:type I restriction enzyme R subunit
VVHTISTREDFAKDIKSISAVHNLSGKQEITVVNIQKFKDDPDVVKPQDYNVAVQRVYFLDEVHRSYNPQGSFLANLSQSDRNAIKIGLTGTPLLGDDSGSRVLFGDYIHKYYYNASIADGYTLRLIREGIETNYKMALEKAISEIEVMQGDVDRKQVYSHRNFVEPMLDYIVEDFQKSRIAMDNNTTGGMVICDSSEQAKKMYAVFLEKYVSLESEPKQSCDYEMAAEDQTNYGSTANEKRKVRSASLILHDIGSKDDRKDLVDDFREGKTDFLFVYNMLLTGFDSPRLKKLYLGRVIKKHNLLQALTRVNRPYQGFKYGFVVDFADIRKEFDATNKAYFDELQSELGDELEHYSNLFKSKEEIEEEIAQIKDVLFLYDTSNAELFAQQVEQIQDKEVLQKLKSALGNARSLYNLIRLQGHYELLEKVDFNTLNTYYREVSNHLALLNLKEKLESGTDTSGLLNLALEDVLFLFKKVSEEELVLADTLKGTLRKTREELGGNFDPIDPNFLSLKEELERLFEKKNLSEVSQEEMKENIDSLNDLYKKAKELNRRNELLKAKYQHDKKYARLHKRFQEKGMFSGAESRMYDALMGVKEQADEVVLQNSDVLNNEGYFDATMIKLVIDQFKNKQKLDLNAYTSKYINQLVVREYMNEMNGVYA